MKISMKNRKIGYTYGSVSGHFSFRKEKSISFESTLEMDLLTLLEFNANVLDVIEQPTTIEYTNSNGRRVTYTPDFLVYFKTQTSPYIDHRFSKPLLIEVKPHDILCKKFTELKPKFKIATKYAHANGYVFKIYDERRIRGQELNNIKFLKRYANEIFDTYETERILSHLHKVGHTAIDHLLLSLYATDIQQGTALRHIWNMLSTQQLSCDIRLPLTLHTVVWVNTIQDDDTHLEGF